MVSGPEKAVFPMVEVVAFPVIITVPGAIILNGKIILAIVSITPNGINLNSDHNPYFWAVNLCANSWRRNEEANKRAREKDIELGIKDPDRLKPTKVTNKVPIPKCLSSVLENENTLFEKLKLREFSGLKYFFCDDVGVSTRWRVIQIFLQSWFSGKRCSAQKLCLQYEQVKGKGSLFPHFSQGN